MQSTQDTSEMTLEMLYYKSEKLRKTLFAHHAAVTAQLVSTKEQLEWVTEEMMKLKRSVNGV